LKNHVIIHAKEPFFQDNKEKFQEMLNDVKKMKNIMHNFDNSDSLCKSKVNIKKIYVLKKELTAILKTQKK
jgi:hypothetical protein